VHVAYRVPFLKHGLLHDRQGLAHASASALQSVAHLGFLIDLKVFFRMLLDQCWLMTSIVGGLILSKFLAAQLASLPMHQAPRYRAKTRSAELSSRRPWLMDVAGCTAALRLEPLRAIRTPLGCSVVVLSAGTALAGPCDTTGRTANLKDAGSGPTSQSTSRTVGVGNDSKEHPPTSTMNRASGDVAASSQDSQRQMQA
jgi:hypothetical protein